MLHLLHNQWVQAAGYLSIFLMPGLFMYGALTQLTWLAFGTVVLVFPLSRLAFGALPAAGPPQWQEKVATALHALPIVYFPVTATCVLVGMAAQARAGGSNATVWIGLGLSLWMTLLFATCVAHELIHRRNPVHTLIGHVLAGFTGYPLLGMEHLRHHGRPGDTDRAEVPRATESMWHFAARRWRRIGTELLGRQSPLWNLQRATPAVNRVRAALVATVVTMVTMAALAGWRGLAVYACTMLGVAFGIQLITFIQHWGLGDQDIAEKVAFGRGWEEDCQFQAWVTLSISLHDNHHQDARVPYYRLALSSDSPRLPTGYVLLMFASMVPAVWRAMVAPARERWLASPERPISAGRRLTCFGVDNRLAER